MLSIVNVGKPIINHPYVYGLYHPFMVICGVVLLLFLFLLIIVIIIIKFIIIFIINMFKPHKIILNLPGHCQQVHGQSCTPGKCHQHLWCFQLNGMADSSGPVLLEE